MTRRASILAIVLAVLMPATADALPGCALGRGSGALRRAIDNESAAIKGARRQQVFATALAAYVYGYPSVLVRRTILRFPSDRVLSFTRLAGASTTSIVAPNQDTLYSVGRLDLSDGPIVIRTPPTAGRYSVLQLTDGFTNAKYVGDSPAARRDGEVAVVVPPGYDGALPAGARVVRVATKLVWLLGRTLADPTAADQMAAATLLSQYAITPLSADSAGTRTPPLLLSDFPAVHTPVTVPTTAAFFGELGDDLAADPPPARDGCALRVFRSVGIGPGRAPRGSLFDAAAAVGPRVVDALVRSLRAGAEWTRGPADTARFGRHYADRATIARIGLGANTVARAVYASATRDVDGRPLSGSHTYRVRFAEGHLPPVRAFWSLALYDRRVLFYANPLNRYAIGDRTPDLVRDGHGGLIVTVSHRRPRGRTNWLPAPAGRFSLYLRLYEPRPAAARWRPPAVRRATDR